MGSDTDDFKSLARTERRSLVKASSALVTRGLQDLANRSQWRVRQVCGARRHGLSVSSVSRFGHVAFCSSEVFGRVLIFDPESDEPLQFTLEDDRLTSRDDWQTVGTFSWSPDGNLLVMAENSYAEKDTSVSRHQIVLFNIRKRDIRVLRPTSLYSWSQRSAWSASGKHVAVTRWFNSGPAIMLWSFDDGCPVDCVAADESLWNDSTWCAAFSPDESCLAALGWADSHSVFLLFDVPSLRLIRRTALSFAPTYLSWHCDGRMLVLGGELDSGLTESFDPETAQLAKLPFDSTSSVCCHPYKSIAAFASSQRITVGDLSQGTILSQFDAPNSIEDMCWNADGTILYALSDFGRFIHSYLLQTDGVGH